ncbi:hypothetical protein RQP46_002256 [Phenoliferia psychrophenolica]
MRPHGSPPKWGLIPIMTAQLAAVKAFIASHETLNPPNPGTWSIRRSYTPPAALSEHLLSCYKFDPVIATSDRRELIRVLLEWLAIWDVRHRRLTFLYAGVGLAMAGLDYPLAERHLRDALVYLNKIGDSNLLWGYGALERVLRAQGKDNEALSIQQQLIAVSNVKGQIGKLNEATYSALELCKGAAGSKVLSHFLIIETEWIPRGVNPIDRFDVVSAFTVTVTEIERIAPDSLAPMAQQIAEYRKRDATRPGFSGASFGRVLLYSKGTGVNAGLRENYVGLIMRLPEALPLQRKHDPGWAETLTGKKAKWGYEHE